MSIEPVSLLGGESVYCINEAQLRDAARLADEDSESSPKIQSQLETIEASLTRNERAALAFVIIERLRKSV
ncbi:MAG TPA: hypothetical protein DIT01_01795 [Lentisphaeria bacterium]|jgi:hypothetical protein|nr:hypothetical protein [Lentisphaeria bacterium]|tara:strand:- start:298 stop:510 length:213 start_codon:yes stop_codon:yes gene_type:complete